MKVFIIFIYHVLKDYLIFETNENKKETLLNFSLFRGLLFVCLA